MCKIGLEGLILLYFVLVRNWGEGVLLFVGVEGYRLYSMSRLVYVVSGVRHQVYGMASMWVSYDAEFVFCFQDHTF